MARKLKHVPLNLLKHSLKKVKLIGQTLLTKLPLEFTEAAEGCSDKPSILVFNVLQDVFPV